MNNPNRFPLDSPRYSISTTASAPLTHLQRLEAESLHILREVVAEAERPVMLYSAGKDSSVLLHLARKAFHPSPPPFPLLHVDTGWKFRDMYKLRDRAAAEAGMELIVHRNPEAERLGILKQRRNISKKDAGLRIIGHSADIAFEPGGLLWIKR